MTPSFLNRVAQIAPEDREQPQLMGFVKRLGDLDDLARGFVGSK